MTPQSTQANPMISLFLLDINHKIRLQYDAHIKHMQGMIRLSVLVATVYRYMRARHIQYTCMIVATSTSSADMPLVPTLLSKSETLGRRKCGTGLSVSTVCEGDWKLTHTFTALY